MATLLLVVSCAGRTQRADAGSLPPAAADHHLHIQGPGLTDLMGKRFQRDPGAFRAYDPRLLQGRGAAEALAVLDSAGIEQGVLLSVAYAFAARSMGVDSVDIPRLMRAENEFVVREAAKSRGRLKAMIGVNPLAPNALEEVEFWGKTPGLGIKLHLANAGFSYENAGNVAKLRAVFSRACDLNMPIAIHARNRGRGFGAREIGVLTNDILSVAGTLPVQIAHGGGMGSMDEGTLAAIRTYRDYMMANPGTSRDLVFDLSYVLDERTTDSVKAKQYVAVMREIGLQHFVYASDWPARKTPVQFQEFVTANLPLTPAEWRTVLRNRSPFLRGGYERCRRL